MEYPWRRTSEASEASNASYGSKARGGELKNIVREIVRKHGRMGSGAVVEIVGQSVVAEVKSMGYQSWTDFLSRIKGLNVTWQGPTHCYVEPEDLKSNIVEVVRKTGRIRDSTLQSILGSSYVAAEIKSLGYSKWTAFLSSIDGVKISREGSDCYVELPRRSESDLKAEILEFVRNLGCTRGSKLQKLVGRSFAAQMKEMGYNSWHGFLSSIGGLKITWQGDECYVDLADFCPTSSDQRQNSDTSLGDSKDFSRRSEATGSSHMSYKRKRVELRVLQAAILEAVSKRNRPIKERHLRSDLLRQEFDVDLHKGFGHQTWTDFLKDIVGIEVDDRDGTVKAASSVDGSSSAASIANGLETAPWKKPAVPEVAADKLSSDILVQETGSLPEAAQGTQHAVAADAKHTTFASDSSEDEAKAKGEEQVQQEKTKAADEEAEVSQEQTKEEEHLDPSGASAGDSRGAYSASSESCKLGFRKRKRISAAPEISPSDPAVATSNYGRFIESRSSEGKEIWLPEDAPDGHPAHTALTYVEGHSAPLAYFFYKNVRFQATLAAAGSEVACRQIARACYMKFEEGWDKDQVLEFRMQCYKHAKGFELDKLERTDDDSDDDKPLTLLMASAPSSSSKRSHTSAPTSDTSAPSSHPSAPAGFTGSSNKAVWRDRALEVLEENGDKLHWKELQQRVVKRWRLTRSPHDLMSQKDSELHALACLPRELLSDGDEFVRLPAKRRLT
eukprot:TRINITY_DN8783_c2_g1_i1.p1 TRINITY_DN8783_c2_g1~~TRINITY_DN8783_c2_g1_i1.p1  ORF type:complete len:730 (+),score=132.25 TRINITY_DN8783_c2_g1_i1:106-2295(+)